MKTVKKLMSLLLCLLMLMGIPLSVSASDSTITLDAVILQEITDTTVTVHLQFSDKIALLNKGKIFLCNHAKQTGCSNNYTDRWQFNCQTLKAIAPTMVNGVSYAKAYTAQFKRCTHDYHTGNLWGEDGLTLPSSAGIRITEYDIEDRALDGISTTVAVGMNGEILKTQDTALSSGTVASHLAWMDVTVPDTVEEHEFSVSHVTKMPEWMMKAGDTEAVDRTLLVYFNTNPTTAPPDNFRFYVKINKTAEPTSGGSPFWSAKYNTNYVFPNHNPIAITLMSEDEATAMADAVTAGTVTGVNASGWTGYNGTLTEAMSSYNSSTYGLRVVLCDSAYSSDTAKYLAGWYNAYGRQIEITKNAQDELQRNNGYIAYSPAEEDILKLDRVVYEDGNTVYAKFSDDVQIDGFGTTFQISLSITNPNNDRMQTATAGVYDGTTGSTSTYYEKMATGIAAMGDGWYKVTFAEGDVDTVLGWKRDFWSDNNYRLAKLCFREKIHTKNFFVESITAENGLPLAASNKTKPWEESSLRADMAAMEVENDLQVRLNLAQAGDIVSLTADVDAGELLMIPSDVTLDLQGHVLTVTNLNSYGDIQDSTEGEGGIRLQGDTTFFALQAGNSDLPLYDSSKACYRFVSYSFAAKTKTPPANAAKYAVRLELPSAEAYALLTDEANRDLIHIDLVLKQSDGTDYKTLDFTFKDATIEEYATMSQNLDEKYALALTVYGLETLEPENLFLTASARVSGHAGVSASGNLE